MAEQVFDLLGVLELLIRSGVRIGVLDASDLTNLKLLCKQADQIASWEAIEGYRRWPPTTHFKTWWELDNRQCSCCGRSGGEALSASLQSFCNALLLFIVLKPSQFSRVTSSLQDRCSCHKPNPQPCACIAKESSRSTMRRPPFYCLTTTSFICLGSLCSAQPSQAKRPRSIGGIHLPFCRLLG